MDDSLATASTATQSVAKRCVRISHILEACSGVGDGEEVAAILDILADQIEKQSVELVLIAGTVRGFVAGRNPQTLANLK